MAPQLTWSRLVPGIIAMTVILGATITLLAFSSVGRLSGDTIRLYVVTNSARGVMKGTEVWLAGQKVGVVENISFRSPDADTLARVVIAMNVREADAAQIRHDSDIRVRAGANLVGPIVVYITAGTPRSLAARHGDTLFASRQSDLQSTLHRLGEVTRGVGPMMADARSVMAMARGRDGTLGTFMHGGMGELRALSSEMSALRARFSDGARPRTDVLRRARLALAQVDSIRTLLRDERTSLGRFRRDSSLGRTLADVREDVAVVRARMIDDRGTLGRFQADSAIQQALASAHAELSLLMADLRKRPHRYIAF